MSRLLLLPALLFAVVLPASSEPAAKTKAKPKTSPAEIARLIKQLGSDDFSQREAATKALAEVGEPALDALGKAASAATDAEARRRAKDLVGSLERRLHGDPPPGELRCLVGHEREVICLAFSADGKQLLSAGRDSTIRTWDVATGKKRRCLDCPHFVEQAAFSADGRRALFGMSGLSATDTIRFFEVAAGKELRGFSLNHAENVRALAFSPDGKRVVCAGDDAIVRLWDADNRKQLRRFTGHEGHVLAVAFSPDGKQVLSGGAHGAARLGDAETGKEVHRVRGQDRSVTCVTFSPDGRRMMTCGTDNVSSIRLFDVARGRAIHCFGVGGTNCVAFSPDSRRVLAGGGDGTVWLWDAETEKPIVRWRTESEKDILSVAFSPDGKLAASGGDEGTIHLWRLPK